MMYSLSMRCLNLMSTHACLGSVLPVQRNFEQLQTACFHGSCVMNNKDTNSLRVCLYLVHTRNTLICSQFLARYMTCILHVALMLQACCLSVCLSVCNCGLRSDSSAEGGNQLVTG